MTAPSQREMVDEVCDTNDITLVQLAYILGVRRETVSRWKSGRLRMPNPAAVLLRLMAEPELFREVISDLIAYPRGDSDFDPVFWRFVK